MRSVAYFPTFKRKFYFSNSLNGRLLLKQFYQPYSFLTKIFCLLWERLPFLSALFNTKTENLPININRIQTILGWRNIDFVLSGGAGVEKKTTGLCINVNTGEKVFFKYGSSALAIKLIKNEIHILSFLSLPTIPALLLNGQEPNSDTWFVTEIFEGFKYSKSKITCEIMDLILAINYVDYPESNEYLGKLKTAFSHGDFCPWNLVVNKEKKIKVIDWEMASVNVLGYDLFTFIFQSSFLLYPRKKTVNLIQENSNWFKYYFIQYNIDDYLPYLKEFSLIKVNKEKKKNNYGLMQSYQNLINILEIL